MQSILFVYSSPALVFAARKVSFIPLGHETFFFTTLITESVILNYHLTGKTRIKTQIKLFLTDDSRMKHTSTQHLRQNKIGFEEDWHFFSKSFGGRGYN